MEQGLPDPVQGDDSPASRGNRIHDAISNGLRRPEDRVSILATCDDPDIVQSCWDEAQSRWDGLTESARSRAKVAVEKVVDLTAIGMDKGTLDFAIVVPPTENESGAIIVLDWKSGMGYVPAAWFNLQLLAYTFGLIQASGITDESTAIDVGIFQPAVRPRADSYKTTVGDILTMTERIKRIVERCERTDAPVVPGGWCQYCRAADRCETRLSVAAEVKAIADPVEVIKGVTGSARREMYDRLTAAIKMLEHAAKAIDAAILSGELTVEGYEIGEGRKTRAWADEQKAIEELQARAAASLTPVPVVMPISVAQAEKVFGKGAFDDLVITKVGNPVVKKVSAKGGKK